MNWNDLRNGVYHVDGSWRDIYVLNTTREDWVKWANYMNENFPLVWSDTESEESKTHDKIDLSAIIQHSDSRDFLSLATVFVGGIQVNAHFFDEGEIENDIDPSGIKSLADHNNWMDYMSFLSTLLGKEVILTEENGKEAVWIRVNKDNIQFVDQAD